MAVHAADDVPTAAAPMTAWAGEISIENDQPVVPGRCRSVGSPPRRQLANLIAGVMLTIAQPLRIGDQVTILDQAGVVEDVRLNYTLRRTTEGRRLLIPNERLASEMIRNDTMLDDRVRPQASVPRPLNADSDVAVSSLSGLEPGLVVRIAEITPGADLADR